MCEKIIVFFSAAIIVIFSNFLYLLMISGSFLSRNPANYISEKLGVQLGRTKPEPDPVNPLMDWVMIEDNGIRLGFELKYLNSVKNRIGLEFVCRVTQIIETSFAVVGPFKCDSFLGEASQRRCDS